MTLGSTSQFRERTMLNVLRAAALVGAVMSGVWLYNALQTGSFIQLTAYAQSR